MGGSELHDRLENRSVDHGAGPLHTVCHGCHGASRPEKVSTSYVSVLADPCNESLEKVVSWCGRSTSWKVEGLHRRHPAKLSLLPPWHRCFPHRGRRLHWRDRRRLAALDFRHRQARRVCTFVGVRHCVFELVRHRGTEASELSRLSLRSHLLCLAAADSIRADGRGNHKCVDAGTWPEIQKLCSVPLAMRSTELHPLPNTLSKGEPSTQRWNCEARSAS